MGILLATYLREVEYDVDLSIYPSSLTYIVHIGSNLPKSGGV